MTAIRTVRIIANPGAGRGRAAAQVGELADQLRARGLEVDIALTEHPGHAVELAADARRSSIEAVVAAGGDGTVHEVVNGLLAEGFQADVPVPVLCPVGLGSGCDYIRTFGIPSGTIGAAERIASGRDPQLVDAGEVVCVDASGVRRRRLFANIAEVGLGAAVVDRATALPRFLGPALYFFSFWLTLPGYRPPEASVEADGKIHPGRVTNLVIAIGRAFGGGMLVAPEADPSDGKFDVQVHRGTKVDYVRGIPKVYRGTHLPHPAITELAASSVEVTASPDVLIEADGEVLGRTPASFRVLPGALRVNV